MIIPVFLHLGKKPTRRRNPKQMYVFLGNFEAQPVTCSTRPTVVAAWIEDQIIPFKMLHMCWQLLFGEWFLGPNTR